MTKAIIGVAGNKQAPGTGELYDTVTSYTPDGFIQGLLEAEALPIIIPLSQVELATEYISQVDKLLLAGGQDVSPQLYQEEPHPLLKGTNLARDLFELALIEAAIKQKKPILGVCRGMQLLNVYFGGSLFQDLSLYDNWQIKHVQTDTYPALLTHTVTLEGDSYLSSIMPEEAMVNSFHHQAVKRLGHDLKAIAYSNDQVIEAIQHQDLPILGVQWHPELSFTQHQQDKELFKYFVHAL